MRQTPTQCYSKNPFFFYILVCILGLQLISCSDSDDNDIDNGGISSPIAKLISGKWDISNSENQFSSIEFNENNVYVIIEKTTKLRSSALLKNTGKGGIKPRSSKASDIIYTGSYQIKDGKTIVLENFGILNIQSLTDRAFKFSLTMTASESGTSKNTNCESTKSKVLSESDRSKLLCSTFWLTENEDQYTIIRFFQSGTYLVSTTSEDGYDVVDWKWVDGKEQEISYDWDGEDKGSFKIDKLTANELIITEYSENDTTTTRCVAVKSGVLPEIPTKEFSLEVRERNSNLANADSAAYKLSKDAKVMFYTKYNGDYNLIYQTKTSAKGIATFKAPLKADTLYYTVEKSDMRPFINNYKIEGIFTSNQQIKDYPTYNEEEIETPKIGSFIFLDKNGDGKIDSQDKFTEQHISQPLDKAKTTQSIVYIGKYDATIAPNIISAQLMSAILYEEFGKVISALYYLDYGLENSPNVFPDCKPVENNNLKFWIACYKFILSSNTAKNYYNTLWDKTDKAYWDQANVIGLHQAQQAYVYTTLVSIYGGVPLIQTTNINQLPKRNTASEIIHFVESETAQTPQKYQLASLQVLARHYMNEKNYQQALSATEKIIQSGVFSLYADSLTVFDTYNNKETLLGGYENKNNLHYKGVYAHPLRYSETVLTAAEAAYKLGNTQKAIQYLNIWTTAHKKGNVQSISESVLRDAYTSELNNEGQWFTTHAKRWQTLSSVKPESTAHNNLLPIPIQEMNTNLNMTQNPGY